MRRPASAHGRRDRRRAAPARADLGGCCHGAEHKAIGMRRYAREADGRRLLARLAQPGRRPVGLPGRRAGQRSCSTAARAYSHGCAQTRPWPRARRDRDQPLPPRPLGRPRAVGVGRRICGPGRDGPRASALCVPPGGHEQLAQLRPRSSAVPDMFERVFGVHEYAPGVAVPGRAASRSCRVARAALPTRRVRASASPTERVRSPTPATRRPSDALVGAARDADLFVCEATLLAASSTASRAATSRSTRPWPRSRRQERSGCC